MKQLADGLNPIEMLEEIRDFLLFVTMFIVKLKQFEEIRHFKHSAGTTYFLLLTI